MGSAKLLEGALEIEVSAVFAPPKSWPAWKRKAALDGRVGHTVTPDADNLAKAAKDALNGVVWRDDAQVVRLITEKSYGDLPRVEIVVQELAAKPSQITRKAALEEAITVC